MELTAVKTIGREYKLKPYGRFRIKWVKKEHSPRTLSSYNLSIFHDTAMPLTPEQEKEWLAEMKKHKTDVFVDEYDNMINNFYTRTGSGITKIYHEKLKWYQENNRFKEMVDEI